MRICSFKYEAGSNLLGLTATSANTYEPTYFSDVTDGYIDRVLLDLGGLYNTGDQQSDAANMIT
mgnify:FL=1